MLNTLPDIKRELNLWKADYISVETVVVSIEEFGEGWNTYASIEGITESREPVAEHFDMGEEESFSRAERRAKRIIDSMKKLSYPVSTYVNGAITA